MDTRFSVLLLNYNQWQYTVACAESLFTSTVRPEQIVICDNGSSDRSLEHLAQWASGASMVWRQVSRADAEAKRSSYAYFAEDVVLVDVGENLGYAGGNNVGLRLLQNSPVPFFWILNNDTQVEASTATALLKYLRDNPRCGACGALTRYMDSPQIVQCYGGGWYNPVWSLGGLHGEGDTLPLGMVPRMAPSRIDYINGASVFLRREFVRDVGLLEEAYFLYCEEWDWAERARGRWELGWSAQAVVLHKEGLTVGVSNRRGLGRSFRSALRLARSRMLFTWKFYPWALPMAFAGQVYALSRKCVAAIRRMAGRWTGCTSAERG